MSNVTDKVVIPGKYETAAEYHAKRLEKVLKITYIFPVIIVVFVDAYSCQRN